VLPVNGSREALFAIGQVVVDRTRDAVVLCPNPFYQIYEGAALLAGAAPVYANATPARRFGVDYAAVPDALWRRAQLLYACSPGNPTGHVMTLDEWREVFDLSDRYGFVIASDECYSELYFDDAQPPLGALEAAHRLGREGFPRLVVFSSLSKRSNVPECGPGFVAGDAEIEGVPPLSDLSRQRESPAVQAASEAAWRDGARRRQPAALPRSSSPRSRSSGPLGLHAGRRVLSMDRTPIDDAFAGAIPEVQCDRAPGSYLAREAHGANPVGTTFASRSSRRGAWKASVGSPSSRPGSRQRASTR
jgi:N-succinyldiaminopimelate aminotransferase